MKQGIFLSVVKNIENNGRILIPKMFRKKLKLSAEDRVMLTVILDTETNENIIEIRKDIQKNENNQD